MRCWWESKTVQLFWKTIWQFLQKLNRVLHDPAILLLGVSPREVKINIRTKTCRQIFIAALFLVVFPKLETPERPPAGRPETGPSQEADPAVSGMDTPRGQEASCASAYSALHFYAISRSGRWTATGSRSVIACGLTGLWSWSHSHKCTKTVPLSLYNGCILWCMLYLDKAA